ncbi:glycoside hydrolase family protein [Micromonospora sp. NPDC049559]|uniref:glycoside hydrolase family protein n=1 Tax=Micromonospora sp. NPDC049559 TaxID=3155923 RepID=UPI0034166BDC
MSETTRRRRTKAVRLLLGVGAATVAATVLATTPALAGGTPPPPPPGKPTDPPDPGPCGPMKTMRDMDMREIKEMIARHESPNGLAGDPHVYRDSRGIPTVGIGFNLNRADAAAALAAVGANYADVLAGRADLTQLQTTLLFEQAMAEAYSAAYRLVPGFDNLSMSRQAVVLDMIFNLGPTGVAQFQNMLAAINRGDFEAAANEMASSAWKTQVGTRATHDIAIMRRGGVCDPKPLPVPPPPVSPDIPGIPVNPVRYPNDVTTIQPSSPPDTTGGGGGVGHMKCNFTRIEVYYENHWVGFLDIYCA